MRFERIVALLLCLVLALGCLASCQTPDDNKQNINPDGQTPNDQTPSGDDTPDEPSTDKYIFTANVIFTSDDPDMKAAANAMSSAMRIKVDGDNVALNQTTISDNLLITKQYTLVDGMLYHSTKISSESLEAEILEKATMDEGDKDDLLSSVGAGAQIGLGDFSSHSISTAEGKNTYTCSNISAGARASLLAIFSRAFASYDATLEIDSVEYVLTMAGERNESSTLSCDFTVVMDGAEYSFTMSISGSYQYTDKAGVSAPNDADSYTEVSYTDIIDG